MDVGPIGFALVLACGPDDGEAPPPPPGGTTSAGLAPSCAANPVVPTVLDCRWSSPAAGVGFVEFWPADAPDEVRATPPGPVGTSHDVAVLGLAAGETYGYRVVVEADGERSTGPDAVHTVPDAPADFPKLELAASDPSRSELAGGYLLVAIAVMRTPRFSVVGIVDGLGRWVWWTRTDTDRLAISPHLSRDGRAVRVLVTDMRWLEDLGTIRRVALDGDETVETRALLGHHTSVENADGTLTWLGFEYRTVDGVDWASDALRTLPEGAAEDEPPTQEFSWFDAYPADPWDPAPGENLVSLGDALEWTHSNSLMALDDRSFFVMSKRLDCLLKVDRATGAIAWQMGGRYSDFTHPDGTPVWRALDDNDLFSGAHMSHLWDGGMLVFDNGDFHVPQRSRVVEYRFDEDVRTVEEVWSFPEPDGGYTGSMGDARRLPGGNTVIAWNALGYVSEVTPDGEIVWELRMPDVAAFGRVLPLASLPP